MPPRTDLSPRASSRRPAPWQSVPARVVGLHAAAELREDHRHHVLLDAAGGEVVLERGERARQRRQLRVLGLGLVAVGVEAAPVDGDDPLLPSWAERSVAASCAYN